jgi:hypothetical protein
VVRTVCKYTCRIVVIVANVIARLRVTVKMAKTNRGPMTRPPVLTSPPKLILSITSSVARRMDDQIRCPTAAALELDPTIFSDRRLLDRDQSTNENPEDPAAEGRRSESGGPSRVFDPRRSRNGMLMRLFNISGLSTRSTCRLSARRVAIRANSMGPPRSAALVISSAAVRTTECRVRMMGRC